LTRNLIVGQSGGPTAVINASLVGVIEGAGASNQIHRIFGMRRGVEGLLEGDVIDLTDLSADTLEALARTPGSALGACRRKISQTEAGELVQSLNEKGVGYLCYIGGNDSADTTHKLALAATIAGDPLRAVAIPKTIDNDLPETDHCPGFASVARYVAIAALESALDTRSLPTYYPVKILEVMGRDAGWLAAASGLAGTDFEMGPHLIYVPELPFERTAFLTAVADIHAQVGYVVIVVAETVRDHHGNPVAGDIATVDEFDHPIARGAADSLIRMVESELGLRARSDKPGTLQRSSRLAQSPVDLAEAREAGKAAVRLALSGATDVMVTVDRVSDDPYGSAMSSADLALIANRQRLLPRDFLDPSGMGISEAFRSYAMPLLGPDPFPDYTKL
jgi:6-phosphofructokinase